MAHNNSKGKYFLGNEFFVYTSDVSTNGTIDSSIVPFAYATECTLSLSADQIDTSNKQSGFWASALPGQISWNISTSALYTTEANYKKMFDKLSKREQVYVRFGQVMNVDEISSTVDASANAAIALDKTAGYYGGFAYITSLELNAGNNEVASFSAEFTGEGALEYKES